MEALAHPAFDEDEESSCPMLKNQLLPGLRSFCSALKGIFLKYHHLKLISVNSQIFCFDARMHLN